MLKKEEYINKLLIGDALNVLKKLPDNIVHTCITSPPYYKLRDYQLKGQIGLEETPEAYIEKLVLVFREVKRVLRNDGTLWINIGDTYNSASSNQNGRIESKSTINAVKYYSNGDCKIGRRKALATIKSKDLIGIPWMLAFALRADGWYLRQDIIWNKPNPMPESVKDRCTKAHEYIFLLSKSDKYYFDYELIKTPSKDPNDNRGMRKNKKRTPTKLISGIRNSGTYKKANKRSVWTVNTQPFKDAHFAVFPEKLILNCIRAGCPEEGIVIDPFFGSGTTGIVSRKLNRNFIGIDLGFKEISDRRMQHELGLFR